VIASHCIEQGSVALQHFLHRFCASIGVAYLRIRFMNDGLERSFGGPLGYVGKSLGNVEIDLHATPSHFIWNSLFSQNRRRKIRRFEREGYDTRQARTKSDLVDFYTLYCDDMKYIGVRPYPYRFLENMWALLYPLNLRIWLVAKGETIGGILILKDGQRAYWLLSGIDRRQAHVGHPVANYLLWKEIQTAEEEGYRHVSLGGTSSDPKDPHHLQKISFGGSFSHQNIVYYPCSFGGRVLLNARTEAVRRWKTIRELLPIRFKLILERELRRFH